VPTHECVVVAQSQVDSLRRHLELICASLNQNQHFRSVDSLGDCDRRLHFLEVVQTFLWRESVPTFTDIFSAIVSLKTQKKNTLHTHVVSIPFQ
jgi:hypothetical protein